MASQLAKSATAHFQLGKRQIFFPQFTVTLLHSPHLPPNYARFQVPLTFNKLDLRDYLFHAYSVRILSVRSSITQGKVERNIQGRLERGSRQKFMIAELLEPFVWPVDPTASNNVNVGYDPKGKTRTDLQTGKPLEDEPWGGFDKEAWLKANAEEEENDDLIKYDPRMAKQIQNRPAPLEHRKKLEEQAKRLLRGEDKWEPTWKTLGLEGPSMNPTSRR